MEKIIRIISIILLIAGTLIIKSCVNERDFDITDSTGKEGTAEVTFLLDVPQITQIATRSETGNVPENIINNVYVLVFDKSSEILISKTKGKNLTAVQGSGNGNGVSFKATLPVGKEYTFMVLANAENLLDGIEVGLAEIEKAGVKTIVVEHPDKWDASSPIPMWGEKNLVLTSGITPTFELTRMLARVNVQVNLKEVSPGISKDNFKLTSIRYYNYNTEGMLIPAEGNYNAGTKYVTHPSIPASAGTKYREALVYDGNDITEDKSCKQKIYVFETAHNGTTYNYPSHNSDWIKNPCIVIGGKYKTDSGTWLEETFYRIDFISKDTTDPENIKENWLSVLRNFSYNVTITEVSGSGFTDPDTALESAPINMEAHILEWNESDMGEIVFDGTFYLSVSRDHIYVPQGTVNEEKEENTLYIKTDYIHQNNINHAQSGWYVEKYVDAADNTTPVTWVKLHPEKGAPDQRIKAYFTFEQNTTNNSRTAVAWIAAGRLRYPVYITQSISSLHIVDPLNNDEHLTRLEFVVPANGVQAQTKPFKVTWTPIDQSVSIKQESPQSWNPFPSEWISPDPGNSWVINNGTGVQTYQVTAPAVSQQLIDQDPFYERESVYSFTVNDGTESETKSIVLHQIYHNIVVDTYSYTLDGNTHQLNVRSNTEWIITNIEEWLYNENPTQTSNASPVLLNLKNTDNLKTGASGGSNISGETLSFTVVNKTHAPHEGKWGTVYITFESPDNKFNPVTVALTFRANSRGLTLLSLGYALDVRAFNPGFNTPYHRQGVNRMLTAEVNFGILPESTVKTEPLNIIGYNCQGQARSSPGNNPDANWYKGSFAKWLNEHNPDIIFITYSMRFEAGDTEILKKYLDNGGAVIMYYGGDVQVLSDLKIVMDKLLNVNLTTSNSFHGTPEGAVYVLENVNDPILNGPFGDVRGKNFGTHIYHTGIKASLIEDQVEILCRMNTMISHTAGSARKDCVNVFRHKTMNLFWVGNAMGTASYYPEEVHLTYDPIRNDDRLRPIPRVGFGPDSSKTFEIHNSHLLMNAVAWAMGVTNHRPPAGGY